MLTRSLPYPSDISQLFSRFADDRHAILLDSGKPQQVQGRFDIFTAFPSREASIDEQGVHTPDSDKNDQKLNDLIRFLQKTAASDGVKSLPFTGGWLGFSTFELGYWLEPVSGKPHQPGTLPLFWAGYYQWAVIQDHKQRTCQLVWQADMDASLLADVEARLSETDCEPEPFQRTQAFEQGSNFTDYQRNFEQIQRYISAGDCYQVNYAMPFKATFTGNAFAAYCKLRSAVPSPFMAYVNHGRQQLLSISPERFIAAEGKRIQSKPIKGTAARSSDPIVDKQQADKLLQSSKNRAENVMIVDLIRNDFSRLCKPGSVNVERLFELESFSNVHHLVSTISGELPENHSVWELFFQSFPGGSITGAPKIRACQIINALEQQNREIYCGSIFLASDNGHFDANICIRTLLCHDQTITAWAGGGIVADSVMEEEYQECRDKIGALLKAL